MAEAMSGDEDWIARLAEQVDQLAELPSPDREERFHALVGGLSPEDRAAFYSFAKQKRAHHGEVFEHYADLVGTAGTGAAADGGKLLDGGVALLLELLKAQDPAALLLQIREAQHENPSDLGRALFAAVVVFGLTREPTDAPPAIAALYESWRRFQDREEGGE
jgi:hypothetical protein